MASELDKLFQQRAHAIKEHDQIRQRMAQRKNMNGYHWDNKIAIEQEIKTINQKILTETKNRTHGG